MLIRYLIKKWPLLLAYCAAIILAPIVQTKCGYVSGNMMDFATKADYPAFVNTLLIYLVYFTVHGILLFLVHTIRIRMVSYCRRDLRQDLFSRIISTNNTFFSKNDTGVHIATFTNDITILENKYFLAWLEAVESIFSIATAIVALFTLDTTLACIIIVGEAFSVVLCFIIRGYFIVKNRIYIETLARFTQRIKDYFSSFQMIQNYSVEERIKRFFIRINNDTERSKDDADMAIAFADILAQSCNSLLQFIVVAYGVVMLISGRITMGLIFTAFQFTSNLSSPMFALITKVNAIESVKSIVDRVKVITAEAREEKKVSDIALTEPATITLNKVSVMLDGEQVLKNVSHTFLPGKKYLIIGRNGAGKSTLLKLLKRSMDNYDGSICINEQDIRGFSYKSLSRIISYINESVSLICDSVRANIALLRDVSEAQVETAANAVGLKVDLDRVICDGERNLSSGEIRRIEIARSLINQVNVIIYDEAISTLDIPTAFEIERTLLSLDHQTIIFVSHNFSSQLISHYDEIILVENGEITAYGSHTDLLVSNDYYRRIIDIKKG